MSTQRNGTQHSLFRGRGQSIVHTEGWGTAKFTQEHSIVHTEEKDTAMSIQRDGTQQYSSKGMGHSIVHTVGWGITLVTQRDGP